MGEDDNWILFNLFFYYPSEGFITLPPINMEPDVRGLLEDHFLLKGRPVRFHVFWWEGKSFSDVPIW